MMRRLLLVTLAISLGFPYLGRAAATAITTAGRSLGQFCAAAQRGCRNPTGAGKAQLALNDSSNPKSDALTWKWTKGEATPLQAFGDPVNQDGYAVCLYEEGGLSPHLVFEAAAAAGGQCGLKPCWKPTGTTGFQYKDSQRLAGGLDQITLKAGADAKAQIAIAAKGISLQLPLLPLALPLRIQLQAANGQCWEAAYSTATKNTAKAFQAKSDAAETPAGLTSVGSLVVIGDSIGTACDFGIGCYGERLRDSLQAHYGSIQYLRTNVGGTTTGQLLPQIASLPSTLPAPVVVAVTAIGDDLLLHRVDPIQTPANINADLDALLAPNRFGSGVDVHVFWANIYDPTDGTGVGGCIPPYPTPLEFTQADAIVANTVLARGQRLVDLYDPFAGHGFNASPSWIGDCIGHPNATGTEQLRRLFYRAITGETLP